MPITRSWQQEVEERERIAQHELIRKQTREAGGVPCDVCAGPATVWISCPAKHFASFRCAQDAIGMVEHLSRGGSKVVAEALQVTA